MLLVQSISWRRWLIANVIYIWKLCVIHFFVASLTFDFNGRRAMWFTTSTPSRCSSSTASSSNALAHIASSSSPLIASDTNRVYSPRTISRDVSADGAVTDAEDLTFAATAASAVPVRGPCLDKFCNTVTPRQRCTRYCRSHCCDFVPLHASDLAKRFAREHPRRLNHLRCNTENCNAMRVRTCGSYCRNHCCWGQHQRQRAQINREYRHRRKKSARRQRREERLERNQQKLSGPGSTNLDTNPGQEIETLSSGV